MHTTRIFISSNLLKTYFPTRITTKPRTVYSVLPHLRRYTNNNNVENDSSQTRFKVISESSPKEDEQFWKQIDLSSLGKTAESISKTEEEQPILQNDKKKNKTQLEGHLIAMMKMRGPMTVASFMREALFNPQFGYYVQKEHKVFGVGGDFITSPEISQMFGELLGIWCISCWQQMNQPSSVHLVELGPGRGTLMADLLRVAKKFAKFGSAITVHMVEASFALRKLQAEKLSNGTATLEKYEDSQSIEFELIPGKKTTIWWHRKFDQVPTGPTLLVAQEFFDCLPVHQFEYTDRGWCERLIDIETDENNPHHFRFVLSPSPTFAAAALLRKDVSPNSIPPTMQSPKSMNNRESSSSSFDGYISARMREFESQRLPGVKGDRIEVCPEGMGLSLEIAERVAKYGGAALIIDYGEDHPLPESIRAIRDHKFVDMFESPGEVDLSILVDFSALRRTATQVADAAAYGTITQSRFLQTMGIRERLASLLKKATPQQTNQLLSSYERLVDEKDGMGRTYKVISIANKSLGIPVGF